MNNSEFEINIATMWFDGDYTYAQAKRSCDLQGLNYKHIQQVYGRLYEEHQRSSQVYYISHNSELYADIRV